MNHQELNFFYCNSNTNILEGRDKMDDKLVETLRNQVSSFEIESVQRGCDS